MRRVRSPLGDALAAAGIAALVGLFFGHAFLNYDSFYALLWGSDLVEGHRPQYGVPFAPTPHPLAIAAGALLSPLGELAEEGMVALALLGLGALAVGLYRLGEELFVASVGALAAIVALTRVPYLSFGVRGYVDLPAVALVVWAAVLEARRPHRGIAVLVLLGLAGLLRPEFWLFSAAYFLWIAPALGWGSRVGAAALAVSAPALWLVGDGLVTGDPLWSLNGTSALAERLERPTGLAAVPRVVPFRLGETIGQGPEVIAAVLGFGAALVWARRRSGLLVALGALNGLAILAFALAGLPLLTRYLFTAAAVLCLFAAFAAFGWGTLDLADPLRRRWRAAGLVVLASFLLFAPVQIGRLIDLRADIAARDEAQEDLRALVASPRARDALERCGPLFAPTHRPIPQLAYWTGLRAADIHSAGLEHPPARGLFVAATSPRVAELALLDPRDPTPAGLRPPAAYRPLARNRSWVLLERCTRGR